MAQQNIYDNEVFFDSFKGLRSDEINFNEVIETPKRSDRDSDHHCNASRHEG